MNQIFCTQEKISKSQTRRYIVGNFLNTLEIHICNYFSIFGNWELMKSTLIFLDFVTAITPLNMLIVSKFIKYSEFEYSLLLIATHLL